MSRTPSHSTSSAAGRIHGKPLPFCASASRLAIMHLLTPFASKRIKVKPEYMDELGENVDVLVVGGFWGQGRRAGRMSSFMVGLRDPTKKEVDGEPW